MSEVKSLSCVRLFATPWTAASQPPLSMGFSRQEYWSGFPFPSPGIFPTQGLNPGLPCCRQTLYTLSRQWSCPTRDGGMAQVARRPGREMVWQFYLWLSETEWALRCPVPSVKIRDLLEDVSQGRCKERVTMEKLTYCKLFTYLVIKHLLNIFFVPDTMLVNKIMQLQTCLNSFMATFAELCVNHYGTQAQARPCTGNTESIVKKAFK